MFVKVKVKFPDGVHLKLFDAERSNEPSLSVVSVPYERPVTVAPVLVTSTLVEPPNCN